MRLIKAIRRILKNFWAYLRSDRKNLFFFVASLPTFFGLYLVLVFIGAWTGLSENLEYRKLRDSDRAIESSEAGIAFLDQGWQERYRQKYYFTPQGSPIIPLDIALSLEMPDSETPIFGKGGSVTSTFGYLPYPDSRVPVSKRQSQQTHGLPIGFTEENLEGVAMLGINCAACHTSNLTYNGHTIRIDGGAGLGDFMGLLGAIDQSLVVTLNTDDKFERLAKNLKADDEKTRALLRERLKITSAKRQRWQLRNAAGIPDDHPHGHARVDAFGIIFNQVLGRDLGRDYPDHNYLEPENIKPNHPSGNVVTPSSPVSYPVLWDTPFMGRVQWNGGANNVSQGGVLGRNAGQVMGVFGETDISVGNKLPGFCSTVNRKNLKLFDYWIRNLDSPLWNDAADADILPPLNADLVSKGKEIYWGKGEYSDLGNSCAGCHSVLDEAFREKPPKRKKTCDIPFTIVDVKGVGTDPGTVNTGKRDKADAGVLIGLPKKKAPGEIVGVTDANISLLREAVAGTIIGSYQSATCKGEIRPRTLVETAAGFGKILRAKQNAGFTRVDAGYELIGKADGVDECENATMMLPRQSSQSADEKPQFSATGYKARPLNGIWASAPYLHNGSVPTLYDLLLPPEKDGICETVPCRPAEFYVGNTDFDPVKVGYQSSYGENFSKYDTRVPGNLNTGHIYGNNQLDHDARMALIEYLKSL